MNIDSTRFAPAHSASTPSPAQLGTLRGGQAQGELFTSALLPRQLPVLKWGPEDALEASRH